MKSNETETSGLFEPLVNCCDRLMNDESISDARLGGSFSAGKRRPTRACSGRRAILSNFSCRTSEPLRLTAGRHLSLERVASAKLQRPCPRPAATATSSTKALFCFFLCPCFFFFSFSAEFSSRKALSLQPFIFWPFSALVSGQCLSDSFFLRLVHLTLQNWGCPTALNEQRQQGIPRPSATKQVYRPIYALCNTVVRILKEKKTHWADCFVELSMM